MAATRDILAYIKDMVASLPGVQWTETGVPKSVPSKVGAFVTLGGQQSPIKTTGTVMRERRFRVTFAYALDGRQDDAELAMCDLVDALIEAALANPTLGGLVGSTDIDAGVADSPRYADRPEWVREYPIVLIARGKQERGRVPGTP